MHGMRRAVVFTTPPIPCLTQCNKLVLPTTNWPAELRTLGRSIVGKCCMLRKHGALAFSKGVVQASQLRLSPVLRHYLDGLAEPPRKGNGEPGRLRRGASARCDKTPLQPSRIIDNQVRT